MRKAMGYGPWVTGLAVFVFFLHTGCFGKETIDPYTWDFGQVREGQIVKHAFRLQNESDKTITIKDTHTSCGCTTSEIKKRVLRPGESAEIGVSFNSKGYSGEVKQFIYVNTDDIDTSTSLGINGERSRTIDNPVIRFIIKAEVIKSSQGEPLP